MTNRPIDQIVAEFIEFLETGNARPTLFSADAFCDFTAPRWRMQAQGPDGIIALRRRGHPCPGKVLRPRCDLIATGFVLELEEEWADAGETWYSREMFRADVVNGAIAQLSVYCTGDWDSKRRAEHARQVQLLRP